MVHGAWWSCAFILDMQSNMICWHVDMSQGWRPPTESSKHFKRCPSATSVNRQRNSSGLSDGSARTSKFWHWEWAVGCHVAVKPFQCAESPNCFVFQDAVFSRMSDFGLSVSEVYCSISDRPLDNVVITAKNETPAAGYQMVRRRLLPMGLHVQWAGMSKPQCIRLTFRSFKIGRSLRTPLTYTCRHQPQIDKVLLMDCMCCTALGEFPLFNVPVLVNRCLYRLSWFPPDSIVIFAGVDGSARRVSPHFTK